MAIDRHTQRLIQEAKRAPKLDLEEELAAIRRWQAERDPSDAARVVTANARHVVYTALGFRHYGVPVPDLISDGHLGLMKALDRFDESRGVRFATYAIYWIRAEIVASVMASWSVMSGPRGALNSRIFFRLRRERSRLSLDLEHSVVVARLAAQFNLSEERMQDMLAQLDGRDVSLDAARANGTTSLLDELSATEDQAALLEREEQRELVQDALERARAALDPRELFILERRLMADPEEELSLGEIGAHFGVSRERVRQLECRARAKLRQEACRAEGEPTIGRAA